MNIFVWRYVGSAIDKLYTEVPYQRDIEKLSGEVKPAEDVTTESPWVFIRNVLEYYQKKYYCRK